MDALRLDWKTILPPEQCSCVLGHPPFIGKHYKTAEQKADMAAVFGRFKNTGDLDYVICWHYRAVVIDGEEEKETVTQADQQPFPPNAGCARMGLAKAFACLRVSAASKTPCVWRPYRNRIRPGWLSGKLVFQ